MRKYHKGYVSWLLLIFAIVFFANTIYAEKDWTTCEEYKKSMSAKTLPNVLIIGSGRGELRYGDKKVTDCYDEFFYGDRKYNYFLVDLCARFNPDCVCDAKNAQCMNRLGIGSWDKCFLEFLPHNVVMNGALANALRLVKRGGKVYFNAENYCSHFYDGGEYFFPKRFITFRKFFLSQLKLPLGETANFCEEIFKNKPLCVDFFRYGYGIEGGIKINLLPVSDEVWCARATRGRDFYIWEITKL